MVVQLSIPVANVNSLIDLGYTKIEVWQSINEGGSYEEITASAAAAATLDSSEALNTFRMGGREIRLSVNGGAEDSITFNTVVDYWTPLQVVNRINEVVAGLASVYAEKYVRLTSPTTGRGSTIEITYCDSPDIGWAANPRVIGKAARITLVDDVLTYSFPDVSGGSDYYYKWRFSANGANPISEYSVRVKGDVPPYADVEIAMCTAQFVGLDGRPQKRRIVVVSDHTPSVISSVAVGSELPMVVDSDDYGYLQVAMVRGSKVRVAIEGTTFVREFIVPDSDSFDLLQVMATAPDPFTVQVTLPFLTRRAI